jgi:serine protease AprX
VKASALWGTGNRGGEHRSSALWGTGNRGGEHRSSALWGTGRGRGLVTLVVAALALAAPLGASASEGKGKGEGKPTYVTAGLLKLADSSPGSKVRVIVQSTEGSSKAENYAKLHGQVKKRLEAANGAAVELSAGQLKQLAKQPGLTITPDNAVALNGFSSNQLWPYQQGFANLWGLASFSMPAIAIVDSGIQNRLDFMGRIRASVKLSSSSADSYGDGRGHGTMVAGIAAGSIAGLAGAAPSAPLVDVDVVDDKGMAYVSDVIAGIDWIIANKSRYGIRVANLSLSAPAGSIRNNPLNDAVERLWFNGVVVVASAGNYGVNGQKTTVRTSPANDPFVITVGAADVGSSSGLWDDSMAPWSAYGYTADGFRKPDLAASGRYMVGPVPSGSTLASERPGNVVSTGYMRLSGTSFSAPVVAGAAAQLIARHPDWTPDRVKGALLATARSIGSNRGAAGFGEVNVSAAANLTNPPNPNAGLNRFLVGDPAGGSTPVFDDAAWAETARTNAAWNEAAWAEAAWAEAGWAEAAWAEAAWAEAAWAEAAWAEAAWAEAAWAENLADNAGGE